MNTQKEKPFCGWGNRSGDDRRRTQNLEGRTTTVGRSSRRVLIFVFLFLVFMHQPGLDFFYHGSKHEVFFFSEYYEMKLEKNVEALLSALESGMLTQDNIMISLSLLLSLLLARSLPLPTLT